MTSLYSQYTSGTEFSAGAIVGSALGTSGLNPLVDRLNSITTDNNLVVGSVISGTATNIYSKYQQGNLWTGSLISGTSTRAVLGDHIGSWAHMAVNVVYGTGSPPTADSTTEGTIFIQYTA